MRVCFLGNMNNMGFVVMRYLLDAGIDTTLLLTEPGNEHFEPKADCCSLQPYAARIKYVGWNRKNYFRTTKREIAAEMARYDFAIGTDYAPLFLHKIGRPLDLFIPHGGDIAHSPFVKLKFPPESKYSVYTWMVKGMFRKAIQAVRYFAMDTTNDLYEEAVDRLQIRGQRLHVAPPMLYLPQYDTPEFERYKLECPLYRQVLAIREKCDVLLFHHCRHEWSRPTFRPRKANHKLLEAFARVVKSTDRRLALVTFAYGQDVDESQRLLRELGVEEHVHWFPTTFRNQLVTALSLCDLGIGELEHSWFSYGVVYELLAFAKPVLHRREDALYTAYHPEMYPMFDAGTTDEVEAWLRVLLEDPERFREVGRQGAAWHEKYAVREAVECYVNLIRGGPCPTS